MASCNRIGRAFLACLVLASIPCRAAAEQSHELRGYGSFTMQTSTVNALTGQRLRFADAERARRFVSKLYGDFLLPHGNYLQPWPTAHGEIDAIALADRGYLLPLLTADAESITVMIGDDRQALIAAAMAQAKSPFMRQAELHHSLGNVPGAEKLSLLLAARIKQKRLASKNTVTTTTEEGIETC